MSAVPKTADISGDPTLLRLIAEARDARQPIVLLAGGRDVAILTPVGAGVLPGTGIRPITSAEDLAAFLSIGGGWTDDENDDALVEVIYAQRLVTPEDIEAFRGSAGAWTDVDVDRLLSDTYADRDRATEARSIPVRWGSAGGC